MSQPEYKLAKQRISLGKKELVEQSVGKLAEWVTEIVREESPVHRDEAYSRFLSAAKKRTGARNTEAFEKGLTQAITSEAVRREGDFLFDTAQATVTIRDRRRLVANSRKFELVADVELDAAILLSVRQSYGIASKDIPVASSRLLGFDRTLESMRQRVDNRVAALLGEGQLLRRNGQIQSID